MCEQGGYAEAALASEEQCYALPAAMTFEEAAAVSLAADTAWIALIERGRLRPGESVLVTGATGAVGNAAVQIAKAKGATVSRPSRVRQSCRAFGKQAPTTPVDLSVANLRDSLREQVHAVNQGRGVDVVIDALGGDVFDAAVRALAWRGRLVVIGFAAGRIATLKTNYLLLKNIETSGLQISDYRKRMPGLMRECFEDIFSLYAEGKLQASSNGTLPAAAIMPAR